MPRITIITPVWNNVDTIAHCIQSIAEQTEPCQHIIIDGGSTDGTLEVIEKEKADSTILISEPDQGMYDAINKGIALADCEVIGVLNSDDYYAHNRVLEEIAAVFEDPSIGASYGDLVYVQRDNVEKVTRKWRSGDYDPCAFYNGWMPPHPTFFLRSSLYQAHGGYRLDMGSAADYELMLRMLLKFQTNTYYIPHTLVRMRNAGMSNASLGNRIKANINDRKAWNVNGLKPGLWTLTMKPLRKVGQWF